MNRGFLAGSFVSGPGTGAVSAHARIAELRRLAEAGDANAQSDLGTAYLGALPGIKPDQAAAIKWLRKAAEKGVPAALTNLGKTLMESADAGERAEAVALLRRAADAGFALGIAHLAWVYWHGLGVEKDLRQAEALYLRAVDMDCPDAMLALGHLYETEKGMLRPKETFRLYKRAADLGLPAALFGAGLAYLNGTLGAPKDEKEAWRCFMLAAQRGLSNAMAQLGEMYEKGQGVSQDLGEARTWYTRASEAGSAYGTERLARLVFYGVGLPRNIVKGFDLFNRAAAAGNVSAELHVAACAECGLGTAYHPARALEGYKKLAGEGLPGALFKLGMVYENGLLGVEADASEATRLFAQAAEKGHPGAAFALRHPHPPLVFAPEKLGIEEKFVVVKAHLGDADGMGRLAGLFWGAWGKNHPGTASVSLDETVRWLAAATVSGKEEAAVTLVSCCLQMPALTDADIEDVRHLLQPHIAAGGTLAESQLNELLLKRNPRPPKAERDRMLRAACQAAEATGTADAANGLGNRYFNLGMRGSFGDPPSTALWLGVKRTLIDEHLLGIVFRCRRQAYFREALSWYKKAAEKQLPAALTNLGDMAYGGYGRRKDFREAFRLYSEAAALGDLTGRVNIAVMQIVGQGCGQNRERGLALLKADAKCSAQALLAHLLFAPDDPDIRMEQIIANRNAVLQRKAREIPCLAFRRQSMTVLYLLASFSKVTIWLIPVILIIWGAVSAARWLWPQIKLGLGIVD